jgi:hypothetical protein
MHIQFPVYRRGNTLVLHVRIAGRQIKRSLRTLDPNLAKVRATQLLGQLMAGELASTQPATHAWSQMNTQASDAATHKDFLTPELALAVSCGAQITPAESTSTSKPPNSLMGRRVPKLPDHEKHVLAAVFAEYAQIKKLRKVTQNDYASYAKEMVQFWGTFFAVTRCGRAGATRFCELINRRWALKT